MERGKGRAEAFPTHPFSPQRGRRGEEGEMTVVYYRGPYAHITQDLLEVWSSEHQVYLISELRAVHVVPGSPGRRAATPLLPAATVLAAVALPVVRAPVSLMALVVVLAVAATVAACLRQGGQPYELYASHRGRWVRLFQCADEQMFGQVKRALARAMEQHADR